jgi:hypothetical protein
MPWSNSRGSAFERVFARLGNHFFLGRQSRGPCATLFRFRLKTCSLVSVETQNKGLFKTQLGLLIFKKEVISFVRPGG